LIAKLNQKRVTTIRSSPTVFWPFLIAESKSLRQ
jgi:hypothetical protein